jgi:site-specific DNA-methyltransferase (adenine-specific)
LTDSLVLEAIDTKDRIRADMGDIDALASSIQAVGLIQPIILSRQNRLIAGERRLRALRKLGLKELLHGIHFIYNDEENELQLKAMEVEENVKRKQLSWQEEVLAKKRLLDIMVQIHGVARAGPPSRSDAIGITSPGFGINKLAALLGESNAQTSKDIELAELIVSAPMLGRAETKEAARRQAVLAVAVATSLQQQAQQPKAEGEARWKLYEGDFINNVNSIDSNSVDLVIVDPPYGEDVQGMGANSKELLAKPFADSKGETITTLRELAMSSYRVLRNDRFAFIFFGFTVYLPLVEALEQAGFVVDITPLVWAKNNVINTSPYTRYGRSYEPILVARKGEPKLIRPSQRDVIQLNTVTVRTPTEQKLYQAQKPVELIEKFILDTTVADQLVVDFCAGSGTTGVAALKNKRRVVLFEKDAVACQIIRSRLGSIK